MALKSQLFLRIDGGAAVDTQKTPGFSIQDDGPDGVTVRATDADFKGPINVRHVFRVRPNMDDVMELLAPVLAEAAGRSQVAIINAGYSHVATFESIFGPPPLPEAEIAYGVGLVPRIVKTLDAFTNEDAADDEDDNQKIQIALTEVKADGSTVSVFNSNDPASSHFGAGYCKVGSYQAFIHSLNTMMSDRDWKDATLGYVAHIQIRHTATKTITLTVMGVPLGHVDALSEALRAKVVRRSAGSTGAAQYFEKVLARCNLIQLTASQNPREAPRESASYGPLVDIMSLLGDSQVALAEPPPLLQKHLALQHKTAGVVTISVDKAPGASDDSLEGSPIASMKSATPGGEKKKLGGMWSLATDRFTTAGKLKSANEEIDKLRIECDKANGTVGRLTEEAKFRDHQLDTLKRQLAELQAKYREDLDKELGKVREKFVEQSAELRQQLADAERNSLDLATQLARLEEEEKQAKEDLLRAEQGRASAELKIDDLENALGNRNADIAALRKQLDDNQNASGRAAGDAAKQLEQLKDELAKVSQEKRERERGEAQAKQQAQDLARELEQKRQQCNAKDTDLEDLRNRCGKLEDDLRATRDRAHGEKLEAERRLGEFQRENDDLKNELQLARQGGDAAVADLRRQLEDMTRANGDLNEKLSAAVQDNMHLKGAKGQLEQSLATTKADLDACRAKRDALHNEKADLARRVAAAEQGLDQCDAERRRMGDELERLRAELAALRDAYDSLAGERDTLKVQLEALQREKDSLLAQKDNDGKLQAQMRADLRKALDDAARQQTELMEWKGEANRTGLALEKEQFEKRALADNLQKKETEAAHFRGEQERLVGENGEMQRNLDREKRERALAQDAANQLRADLQAAELRNEKETGRRGRAEQEIEKLKTQLAGLQGRLGTETDRADAAEQDAAAQRRAMLEQQAAHATALAGLQGELERAQNDRTAEEDKAVHLQNLLDQLKDKVARREQDLSNAKAELEDERREKEAQKEKKWKARSALETANHNAASLNRRLEAAQAELGEWKDRAMAAEAAERAAQEKVDAAKRECDLTHDRLARAQDDNADLVQKNGILEDRVADLSKTVDGLHADKAAKAAEVSGLQARLNGMSDELSKLELERAALAQERDQLQTAIHRQQPKMLQLEEELAAALAEKNALNEQLAVADAQRATLVDKARVAENAVAQLEAAAARARTEYEDLKNELAAALDRVAAAREDATAAAEEARNARAEKEMMKGVQDRLRDENEQALARLEDAQAEIDASRAEHDERARELRQAFADQEALRSQLAMVEGDKHQQDQMIAAFRQQLADFENDIAQCKREIAKKGSELAAAEGDRKRWEAQVEQLQAAVSAAKDKERALLREVETEKAKARQAATENELELDALRREQAKKEGELAAAARDMRYTTEQLNDLKVELDAALDRERKINSDLEGQNAALARLERLRADEAREARDEHQRLSDNYSKMRKERDAARQSTADVQQRLKDEEGRVRAAELQTRQAQVELETAQTQLRDCSAAKGKLRDEIDDLKDQLAKLQGEKLNFDRSAKEAQQEIQHLQLDIEAIRRDRDAAKRSLAVLQADNEELAHRIENLQLTAEDDESKLRRCHDRVHVLEAELEDLRSRLIAAEDAEARTDARFTSERTKLQRMLDECRAQNKRLKGDLDQIDEASGAALRRLQSVVTVADFSASNDDPASAFHLLLRVIQQLLTEVEEARTKFKEQSTLLRQLQLSIQSNAADLSGLSSQVPKLLATLPGSPRSAAGRSPIAPLSENGSPKRSAMRSISPIKPRVELSSVAVNGRHDAYATSYSRRTEEAPSLFTATRGAEAGSLPATTRAGDSAVYTTTRLHESSSVYRTGGGYGADAGSVPRNGAGSVKGSVAWRSMNLSRKGVPEEGRVEEPDLADSPYAVGAAVAGHGHMTPTAAGAAGAGAGVAARQADPTPFSNAHWTPRHSPRHRSPTRRREVSPYAAPTSLPRGGREPSAAASVHATPVPISTGLQRALAIVRGVTPEPS